VEGQAAVGGEAERELVDASRARPVVAFELSHGREDAAAEVGRDFGDDLELDLGSPLGRHADARFRAVLALAA
jgi:hypothetical protein